MSRIKYVGDNWDPYYAQANVKTWLIYTQDWIYDLHLWPDGGWTINRSDKDGRGRYPIPPRIRTWLINRYATDELRMEAML